MQPLPLIPMLPRWMLPSSMMPLLLLVLLLPMFLFLPPLLLLPATLLPPQLLLLLLIPRSSRTVFPVLVMAAAAAATISSDAAKDGGGASDPAAGAKDGDTATDVDVVFVVGRARYLPPYGRYGPEVATVLSSFRQRKWRKLRRRQGGSEDILPLLELASFYADLGDAYFFYLDPPSASASSVDKDDDAGGGERPAAGSDDADDDDDDDDDLAMLGVPYRLELARNAYEEAERTLRRIDGDIDDIDGDAATATKTKTQALAVASVLYKLGEVLLADPDLRYLEEAVARYEEARVVYGRLRHRQHSHDGGDDDDDNDGIRSIRVKTDKGYADATAKAGMAILMKVSYGGGGVGGVGGGIGIGIGNIDDDLAFLTEAWNDNNAYGASQDSNNGAGGSMGWDSYYYNDERAALEQAREDADEQISIAAAHLDAAILVYKKYLDQTEEFETSSSSSSPQSRRPLPLLSPQERYEFHASLALAYQQAATAATLAGGGGVGGGQLHQKQQQQQHHRSRLVRSRDLLRRALKVHTEELIPESVRNEDGPTLASSKESVAYLHLSLADASLQLGDYVAAKDSYRHAVAWYQMHDLPVVTSAATTATGTGSGVDNVNAVVEESIKAYVHQLEEYRRLAHGGGGTLKTDGTDALYPPRADQEDALYYMERDDGYEGDLLATIGALYLSMVQDDGDGEASGRGILYLQQAIELYGRDDDNDAGGGGALPRQKNRRASADAQFNLAVAYFRSRQFAQSQVAHFDALDAYRELYGDGVNPYLHIMDEYREMVVQQAGEAAGDEYLQNIMAAMGMGRTGDDDGNEGDDAGPRTIDMDQYYKANAASSLSAFNTTDGDKDTDDDDDQYGLDYEEANKDEAAHESDEL